MSDRSSSFIVRQANAIDFASGFEQLRRAADFDAAMISTTLPRGGLQVAHIHRVDGNLARVYSRELHALDAVAWQALSQIGPMRWSDVREDHEFGAVAARLGHAVLQPLRIEQYAAAPLAGPLFEGYPGVLHVFRGEDSEDFSEAELQALAVAAQELDEATAQIRRLRGSDEDAYPLLHSMECRQIVVSRSGQVLLPGRGAEAIEPSIREPLLRSIQQSISMYERVVLESSKASVGERAGRTSGNGRGPVLVGNAAGAKSSPLTVPDDSGEQWIFRLAIFKSLPALTGAMNEPVAAVSLPPECDAWALIRSEDIQADPELARLVPAIHYMHQNFASGINLAEVARSVHLSPFHFHRRFTELLGTTPKHFLFDCQIAHAKHHLARGQKPLAQIASEAGFAHQSHFTSRFRQATGLTPTKWKRLVHQVRSAHEPAHG